MKSELNKHRKLLTGWLNNTDKLFDCIILKNENSDWDLIKYIENLIKQAHIEETTVWREWITVRGLDPITLEMIDQRLKELKGEIK